MRNTSAILGTTLVLCLAGLPLSADVNFGGQARFIGMGGAGLAATDSPAVTAMINPAALGMLPRRLHLALPSANFRTEGASLGDITDWAADISNLSGPEGIELAREFGKHDTMLDVSVSMGILGSPLSVMLDGEARARIIPNAAFREFAETGDLPADPAAMEAVVWAEAAYSAPSVSLGFKVPSIATGSGDLWLGTRVRAVRGKYVRRTVSWSGSYDPSDLLTTSDEPVEDENGIGADLGVIYRAPGQRNLSLGVAVTNLIKPDLGNIEQDTIVSAGMAVRPNRRTVFVADLVNITDAYDEGMDLRVGIEVRPVRSLALRVGHSGESFTAGIGLFGFDVAYASDTPLAIARTIRF